MLQRFLTWIRGVFTKMLHINDAKRSLKVDVAISTEMQAAIDQWAMMFIDRAPWLDDTTQSLGLPAAIAGEIARLTTVELESSITGSARADYLQGEYERVLNELRSQVETAAAGGGLVFKPYVDGERIAVDCVPAWRFLPTAFNSRGEVTGAVFVEQVTRGKTYYTRMEHHQLTDDGYTIRNLAYSSLSQGTLGNPCSLAAVDEWADLEPELTIRYKDGTAPEGVLFAYFRLPFSNTVDPESPLGVSVYSRAVGLIREADRQYSRILWEYEGSELAIDASQGALQVSGPDGRPATLPPRSKRLFRELAIDQGQSGDLYKVFNPAIRDTSLFNGLDKANRYFSLSGPEENLREYLKEKPIIDLLEQQGVEYKQRISEKEIIVSAGAPKIVSESAHAVENRAVKTDRADMTAERAQSFVDSAKLTLYQPERQTLKFMAEDGYAVLNFDHKLVTAVPQKWRKKYDDYLEENQ